jgi:methyltransferase (TIGR00027 family)
VQTGQPSYTALGAARHRADHQELDGATFFRDPLARAIAGDPLPSDDPGSEPAAEMRRRMRMFIAIRSRYAEDALAGAVAGGGGSGPATRQLVILGAGLDTFAYRNPHPGLRVFEVDHPDTQAWKRDRLAAAQIEVPPSVTYVPVDFEGTSAVDGGLDRALSTAGLQSAPPVFVIWLGVTIYLTRQAIEDTFAVIGGLAPGSQVVFDYGTPRPEPADPELRALNEERDRRLAAIGERWISVFTPDGISELLHANGFRVEEDITGVELAGRYLNRPAAGGTGPHLVRARVVSPRQPA